MSDHQMEHHDQQPNQIDNPWLLWIIPAFLTGVGAVVGWIFGPVYGAVTNPASTKLDVYSQQNFDFSERGALICAVAGLIIGVGVRIALTQFPKKDAVHLPQEDHH